ncbi:MAG: hypothetical protein WA265_17250, partial [Rhodomicrobium sp.]
SPFGTFSILPSEGPFFDYHGFTTSHFVYHKKPFYDTQTQLFRIDDTQATTPRGRNAQCLN